MKTIKIILILLFCTGLTRAQWVPTNGPYGGTLVRPIASNGNVLYAGTSNGLYKSINEGNNWQKISNGFTGQYPMEMTFSNNNYYVATWGDGILKSTNQGQSWFHINSPSTVIYSINSIGNTLFAGTGGLYGSTDGGNTWNMLLYINPPSFTVFALAVNGGAVYVGNKGIHRSTDNGISWSQIFQDSTHNFSSLIVSGSNLYAAPLSVNEYGAWVSTNSGTSWALMNNGLPGYSDQGTTAMAYDGSNLYQAYYFPPPFLPGYLYYSSNNGVNFYPMGADLPYRRIFSLKSAGNELYVGTNGAGVYSTTNLGSTWVPKNYGITSEISCLSGNGNLLFAGTNYALHFSTDGGNLWNSTGLTNQQNIRAVATNNGKVFASADSGVYISTNNGANFTLSLREQINEFLPDGPNLFGCGWFTGIILTTDNGLNWTTLNSGIQYLNTTTLVRKGTKLFCGTGDGNYNHNFLYESTNNGLNWITTSLSHFLIFSLIVQGNSIIAGTQSGVYVSTDDGVSWSHSQSQIPKIAESLAGAQNVLFASSDSYFTILDSGIYYSTDGGFNWNPYNDGLVNYHIHTLKLNGNTLYAGTLGESVWKRDVSSLVGVQSSGTNIPDKFALYQNYPNPFNPSTKISYDLPSAINIKLVVYDMLGREEKTLVNEKQNAGRHEIEFDASNYPSGVYYYKLSAGNYTNTKKMVLIK